MKTTKSSTPEPTDDQSLKIFLAGKLEEDISATEYVNFGSDGTFINYGIRWIDGGHRIKDTEWPHITRLVEQQLDGNEQKTRYVFELVQVQGVGIGFEWAVVHAAWQDKAKALRRVLEP